jgi:hypothetical protein
MPTGPTSSLFYAIRDRLPCAFHLTIVSTIMTQTAPPSGRLGYAIEPQSFVMPPKKASATGVAALQPLDPNQDVLSLREARSQKRKATSPTPPEDDLDQEIQNLEMLHQQVQRKKEKMARLADLQRQIDEASEEVRHLVQDDQNRRPPHRELHQEGFYNEDD